MSPLVLLLNFAEILLQILWVAILIRVLLSWFPIDPRNPIIRVLFEITEPVLAPFRRVIPRIGMFDLSPLAALLVIQLIQQGLPQMVLGLR
jgi:YggT family protein